MAREIESRSFLMCLYACAPQTLFLPAKLSHVPNLERVFKNFMFGFRERSPGEIYFQLFADGKSSRAPNMGKVFWVLFWVLEIGSLAKFIFLAFRDR